MTLNEKITFHSFFFVSIKMHNYYKFEHINAATSEIIIKVRNVNVVAIQYNLDYLCGG